MTSIDKTGLRIVFAGTPEFAAEHLKALLSSRHSVIAAYSQPDRPAGRGKKLSASPVKEVALAAGIPVYQPLNFKSDEAIAELAALNADLMVVVAYGLILPKAVLEMPKYGCINVHASLLPRWRGAAPIQRAIEAGDTETGVTIMQMDVGLDTGDMLDIAKCPILAEDTGQSLHDRLIILGEAALLDVLDHIQKGTLDPIKQDDNLSNYAPKLSKEEAALDWRLSAAELERKVRAFNPFPVAFTGLVFDEMPRPVGDGRGYGDGNGGGGGGDGRGDKENGGDKESGGSRPALRERIRVWGASVGDTQKTYTADDLGKIVKIDAQGLWVACARGSIILEKLQLSGKKVMNVGEILRGHPELFRVGDRFEMNLGAEAGL